MTVTGCLLWVQNLILVVSVHYGLISDCFIKKPSWAPSQYKKKHLSRYRDSHYKDEMVARLSYLYNGNLYTGKMACLYWDTPWIRGYSAKRALSAIELWGKHLFQDPSNLVVNTLNRFEIRSIFQRCPEICIARFYKLLHFFSPFFFSCKIMACHWFSNLSHGCSY